MRLLPWVLDPQVTFRLAWPFARGLLTLAGEAALLVGWPIGWALAGARFVERGEARAVAALGQSPVECVLGLRVQGALFACALGAVSFLGGRDASEPGRVVTDLLERGRETCAEVSEQTSYAVPFVGATWLCSPGQAPRLAGHGMGRLSRAMFTAARARVSGDLREISMIGARLLLNSGASGGPGPGAGVGAGAGAGGGPGGGANLVNVQAAELHLRGLPPFAHASAVSPLARAAAYALAGAVAATSALLLILRGTLRGRLAAIVVAAAGSLVPMGMMRAIEPRLSGGGGLVALPVAACAAVLLATACLSRLPGRRRTASK